MAETGKVIDNEKKGKNLEEDEMKSTPAPAGMDAFECIYSGIKPPGLYEVKKGFFTTIPNITPNTEFFTFNGFKIPVDLGKPIWPEKLKEHKRCGPSKSPYGNFNICAGGPTKLNLKRPDPEVDAYAAEAVKEYNSREYKDKLELVKVKKGTGSAVAGILFDLTFDAKVLADGEGERTQTYRAKVWCKIDGTLEVLSFKLVRDAQGNKAWFWKHY